MELENQCLALAKPGSGDIFFERSSLDQEDPVKAFSEMAKRIVAMFIFEERESF